MEINKNLENLLNKTIFILGILSLLILIYFSPVTSIMESRNFQSAEEIVKNGKWLIPTLNGHPRVKKPPLTIWSIGIMGKYFGTRNIFYLRLPNIIASLLLLIFIYLISLEIFKNSFIAILNTIICLCSFKFIGEAKTFRWDMFLTSFSIGSLYFLIKFIIKDELFYLILSIIFIILSSLSKGIVGFLVIIVPFFISLIILKYLLKEKSNIPLFNLNKKIIFFIVIYSIFSLIIGNIWWLFLKYYYPQTFQIMSQDIKHLIKSHSKNIFYYFYQLPYLILPWSILFLGIIYIFIKDFMQNKRDYFKETNKIKIFFIFLWTLISFIFLTIFPAKKTSYFLYIIPSISIFMGASIYYYLILAEKNSKDKKILNLIFISYKVILIIGFCFLIIFNIFLYFKYKISLFIVILFSFIFLLCIYLIYKYIKNLKQIIYAIGYSMLIIVIFIPISLLKTPLLKNKYKDAYKIKNLTQNKELYVVGGCSDKLLWNLGRCYKGIPLNIEKIKDSILNKEKKDKYCFILLNDENKNKFEHILKELKQKLKKYNINSQIIYFFKAKRVKWFLYKIQLGF